MSSDDLFIKAVGELKIQIASLHEVSDHIKGAANDVATAPGVRGYMEQAVTCTAQAAAFIAQLPQAGIGRMKWP